MAKFEFKHLVGHLVRIAYQDGGEVLVKVGRVVSVSNEFIEFRTRHNTYFVRHDAVVSLKIKENEEGDLHG